jgi:hypothetical protein
MTRPAFQKFWQGIREYRLNLPSSLADDSERSFNELIEKAYSRAIMMAQETSNNSGAAD